MKLGDKILKTEASLLLSLLLLLLLSLLLLSSSLLLLIFQPQICSQSVVFVSFQNGCFCFFVSLTLFSFDGAFVVKAFCFVLNNNNNNKQ